VNSTHSEPQWNLLPFDAEGFFNLDEGYSRKDLKRAYNRLIKQFKPEKFPDEFKKIRAAYELLDQQMRYGTQIERLPISLSEYSWEVTGEEKPGKAHFDRETDPVKSSRIAPLHERLLTELPENLYIELKKLDTKRPYDYFALAVLSDVLSEANGSNFSRWLLEGIQTYPEDTGLMTLLVAYFRNPLPTKTAIRLVKATSKIIQNDRFFFVTEPLWDQLLFRMEFNDFQKLLVECESNLTDHRIHGRLTFYVHLLKPALWKAEVEWIDQAFDFINENFQELSGSLDYDLELLYLIREYINHRDDFLNGDPIREQLDRSIIAFCTRDRDEIDMLIVDCQVKLALGLEPLLETLPCKTNSPYNYVTNLWQMISDEVAERIETENDFPLSREQVLSLKTLLYSLMRKTENSIVGRVMGIAIYIMMLALCTVYLLCSSIIINTVEFVTPISFDDDVFTISYLAAIPCLAAAYFPARWINRKVTLPAWWFLDGRVAEFLYRRIWRRELGLHITQTAIPYSIMFQGMEALHEEHAKSSASSTTECFSHDYALVVFSSAQRFLA